MSRPPRRPRHRAWTVLALAVLALVASACQVRVATDVTVADDGSGRMALMVALDEDLANSLEADGFDPFAPLEDLPDGWEVERSEPDGGLAATITADFDDPDGLARRVEELRAGTDAEDPLLLDAIVLDVAEDGSATLRGRAGLRPPSSTGLRGVGVQFDGDDLATLLQERGDEVVRVDLRVTMPGPVRDSNADEVDGRTATWQLPVTELTDVSLASDPPSDRTVWIVGAAVLIGVVVGSLAVGMVRRRR